MVSIGLSQSTIDYFERRAWREGASRDETADAIAEGEAEFRASLEKPTDAPRDTLITPPPDDR